MRTLRSLAFLAALLPGIAAAQLPYPNIPQNTIVGRIGTTSGPAFAIPFSTLVAQMGAVPTTRIINTTAPLAGGGNLNTDLTLTFAAQAPNLIFAGPTSGGSVVPSFRAMVQADISASIVSNAKLANAPAYTLKGNATNASATPTDIDITALTAKATPGSGDIVLIQDVSAGNQYKKTTVNGLQGVASVSSVDSKTGAFTTGNGLDSTGGNVIELTAARRTLPTTSLCVSSGTGCSSGGFGGVGTYTTPANVLWIEIYMIGATGGGGGTGSAGGTSAGGAGGNTCWNTTGSACTTPVFQAGGGTGGAVGGTAANSNGGIGGAGGTVSGSGTPTNSSIGAEGSFGSPGGSGIFTGRGGIGGYSACGGGMANQGGDGAIGITGAGGGGGGGGGACVHTIINTPAATYTYSVGAAGTAGAAGTSGTAGTIGIVGRILVIEHYGT